MMDFAIVYDNDVLFLQLRFTLREEIDFEKLHEFFFRYTPSVYIASNVPIDRHCWKKTEVVCFSRFHLHTNSLALRSSSPLATTHFPVEAGFIEEDEFFSFPLT